MVKKITSLNIDTDVVESAKRMGMNLSQFTEQAIRDKIGKKQVEIDKPLKCEFCGREGEKETADDIKMKGHYSGNNKLTWLYPDERWICNLCLRKKII